MKKMLQHICLILLLAAGLSSCKNNIPKEAKYIPKDANFVLVLDPQQMQDKLQKGGISMDTLLSRVFKKDSSDKKDKAKFEALKDNAGINWGNQLFLFMQNKTNSDNSVTNAFSILGGLKDVAKWEAFLKTEEELKDKEIKKEKDYSYLYTSEGSILAWNDQQIIATMYTHTQKPVYDSVAMTFKQPAPINLNAEMKEQVTRYFTQKVSESMADLGMFTDMFKEKADGFVFTSANSSLAGLQMLPIQLPKLEELVKDNYVTGTLSFEDGKIIAKANSYPSKLLGNVLKQYAGPTVKLSMLDHYPSKNINGIMLASFNPEIFGGILQQLEVEGLVNNFLEKTGITSQDLYHSLKGDICVVVSDLGMSEQVPEPQNKHDEKSMTHKKSMGKMIFTAPVGDKASFFKLMDKAVEQGMLVKQQDKYKAAGLISSIGLYVSADEKNLVIASDSLTYADYVSNTFQSAIPQETLNRFKGKSTVLYFDIANTLNGFGKDSSGSYHQSMTTAKHTFKDLLASSENFDGKRIPSVFEIRMQNEKQNSLVTLTSLFTDIAIDMRVQAKREKENEEKLFPGGVPAIIRTN